jgi:hypothetical protein
MAPAASPRMNAPTWYMNPGQISAEARTRAPIFLVAGARDPQAGALRRVRGCTTPVTGGALIGVLSGGRRSERPCVVAWLRER